MQKQQLSILLILFSMQIAAQNEVAKLKEKTKIATDKIESRCVAWRRDFHEHPELGNREFRTSKIIAEHLKKLDFEVKEGVAKTGVVGILKGGKPGPCIALRADMDALPAPQ